MCHWPHRGTAFNPRSSYQTNQINHYREIKDPMKKLTLIAALLALTFSACGSGVGDQPDAQASPLAPQWADANTNSIDEPLFIGNEPRDGIDAPVHSLDDTISQGFTVSDAITADSDGPLTVSGFYVSDGNQTMLCDALAESHPPQCGGSKVAFDTSGIDLGLLQQANGTTWSDDMVTVLGELTDGTFVAIPMS